MSIKNSIKRLLILLPVIAAMTLLPQSAAGMEEIRIPVYAAEANRGPAAPLHQKELTLYLDNVPTPFSLETHDENDSETGKLNIIILDSTLSTYNDFVNGKRIAEKLVNSFPPCDTFAVIQLSPLAGLRLICPPFPAGTDKKLALAQIKTLELYPELSKKFSLGFERVLRDIQSIRYNRSGIHIPGSHSKAIKKIKQIFSEAYYYETQTLRFSYFLSKFKNALDMIPKPKVVYLLSGSPEKDPPETNPHSLLTRRDYEYTTFAGDFREKLIKTMNQSGCLVFNIDTRKQGHTVPHAPLFYQLRFSRAFKPGESVSVRLHCTREGINLSYPPCIVPAHSYESMDNRQKRLFLLDVILEEPWVQLAAPVEKVPFKISAESLQPGEETTGSDTLQIVLPGGMYRGDVDVYTFYIDPGTRKARIRFSQRIAREDVTLTIDKAKDKHRFFVVVEPAETYCIYNQVK